MMHPKTTQGVVRETSLVAVAVVARVETTGKVASFIVAQVLANGSGLSIRPFLVRLVSSYL